MHHTHHPIPKPKSVAKPAVAKPVVKAPPPAERRRARGGEALEEVVQTVDEADLEEEADDETEEPEEPAYEDA